MAAVYCYDGEPLRFLASRKSGTSLRLKLRCRDVLSTVRISADSLRYNCPGKIVNNLIRRVHLKYKSWQNSRGFTGRY